ncbi:MAG: hypothetical protein ACRELY_29680, partial [Polyangiaceae bacterium]
MTSKKRRGHGGSVYSDMSAWADGAALFHKKFEASFATREKVPRYERRLQLREVKPLLVYSLMNEFVSPRPNGFYTFLGQGFPGDNLVWWDFFMSSGPHLIAILNGANGLEAQIYSEPEGFDVEKFLMNNIARYHDRVHARIKG